MSIPIRGNPEIDEEFAGLLERMQAGIEGGAQAWRNLSADLLQDLRIAAGVISAETEYYAHIRAKQSAGGRVGAQRVRERRATGNDTENGAAAESGDEVAETEDDLAGVTEDPL